MNNDELYYSIPDVARAYDVSPTTLKYMIDKGEIKAKIQRTCPTNPNMTKRLIPASEIPKLKYRKKCELVAREMSQPKYYEAIFRRYKTRP
ncbi:MAG: helix-turn-helix domain-containing protein [Synergistaceae bacterium]|nr:helix-turn-helix domain-containing protein [Synergistaceae bacterium]MBQ6113899.1 helix-turn-helix domain-containing protein [Synergistaceae bacterium]MBR0249292.1 helix-turn-helix domain-containing protein [Synergistaceae bacterium]